MTETRLPEEVVALLDENATPERVAAIFEQSAASDVETAQQSLQPGRTPLHFYAQSAYMRLLSAVAIRLCDRDFNEPLLHGKETVEDGRHDGTKCKRCAWVKQGDKDRATWKYLKHVLAAYQALRSVSKSQGEGRTNG